MNQKQNIIILGGGQAAAYAAKEIRSVDNVSNLTIISEENFYHMKDLLFPKIAY